MDLILDFIMAIPEKLYELLPDSPVIALKLEQLPNANFMAQLVHSV